MEREENVAGNRENIDIDKEIKEGRNPHSNRGNVNMNKEIYVTTNRGNVNREKNKKTNKKFIICT